MNFSTNNANEHRCLQQFLSCLLQNSKLNSYLVNNFILCLSVLRILLDTSVNFFVLFLWLVLLLLVISVMLLWFLVLFWPPFLVAVFISFFLISNLQSLLLDRINYFSSGVICTSNRNNNNNTATKQQPKQTIGERVPLWSLSYQRMAKIKHCT